MRWGAWLAIATLGCVQTVDGPATEPRVETTPAPTTFVPAVPAPTPRTRGLSLAGFREGRIELATSDNQAFALIDGEPIALTAGQALIRDPKLGLGLGPDKPALASSHELVAFGGSLARSTAQLVVAEHFAGAGSAYFHYARGPDQWTARELARRGGELQIETRYAAIVETGSALLGLRRYAIRSDLWDYGDPDDPSIQDQLAKLGRELGKAPRGFVVLAGQLDAVPALAKGWDASDAVSTPDGQIVALGYSHRASIDGDDGPARILSWAPGQSTATVAELPGLVEPNAHELELWASGDRVLIGGLRDLPGISLDQPYLAIRDPDGQLREVELTLPAQVSERVASAAATATGELWIVTGAYNYASVRPCPCLWRKPVDGDWEVVELGPVTPFRDAESRWAHVLAEQTWIEVPAAAAPRLYPAARSVIHADGVIWVSAELGPSYPSADPVLGDPRMLLFSSVPAPAPTELIPSDQLYDERVDRRVATAGFKPGSDDCRTFTMLIADDPDGPGRPALDDLVGHLDELRGVATLEREDAWASASMIYVGALDGHPQLVVEASAWNPKSAVALADAFAQVLGHRPQLDCRPRTMVRAIERLR